MQPMRQGTGGLCRIGLRGAECAGARACVRARCFFACVHVNTAILSVNIAVDPRVLDWRRGVSSVKLGETAACNSRT